MKAFVSFADGPSGDREVAGKYIEGLRHQGVEVFDYTRPSSSSVGNELRTKLRDQISLSNVFVFLASEKSTCPTRQMIVEEVELAISFAKSGGLLIYPVVLAQHAPKRHWIAIPDLALKRAFSRETADTTLLAHLRLSSVHRFQDLLFFRENEWTEFLNAFSPLIHATLYKARRLQYFGPFDCILTSLEYEILHSTNTERIDTSIQYICQKLGLVYTPRIAHHPRLPLRTKMMEELSEFRERHALPEYAAQTLLDFAIGFEADRVLANWIDCLGCIDGAIQVLRGISKLTGQEIACPYLHVAKGVCLYQMGEVDAAQRLCQQLLEKGFTCEGNVSGLLARILLHRKEFKDAIAESSLSIEQAESIDGRPAFLARVDRLRMAFTVIEQLQPEGCESNQALLDWCHLLIRDEWVFDEIDSIELMTDRERIEFSRVRAYRHFLLSEFDNAKAILQRLISKPLREFSSSMRLPDSMDGDIPSELLAYLSREEVMLGDRASVQFSHGASGVMLVDDGMLVTLTQMTSDSVSLFYLDEDIAILNTRVLLALSEMDNARDFLKECGSRLHTRAILHFNAAVEDVYFQDPSQALDIVLRLLQTADRHPIDLVLASWLAKRVGRTSFGIDLAKKAILELIGVENASTSEDYYLGFAYFLAEREEIASHYFMKSRERVWYDKFSW